EHHHAQRVVGVGLADREDALAEECVHILDQRAQVALEAVLKPLFEGRIFSEVELDLGLEPGGAGAEAELVDVDAGSGEKVVEPGPVALGYQGLTRHDRVLGQLVAEGAGRGEQEVAHVELGGEVQVLPHVAQHDDGAAGLESALEAMQLGALAGAAEAAEELGGGLRRQLDAELELAYRIGGGGRAPVVERDVEVLVVDRIKRAIFELPVELFDELEVGGLHGEDAVPQRAAWAGSGGGFAEGLLPGGDLEFEALEG